MGLSVCLSLFIYELWWITKREPRITHQGRNELDSRIEEEKREEGIPDGGITIGSWSRCHGSVFSGQRELSRRKRRRRRRWLGTHHHHHPWAFIRKEKKSGILLGSRNSPPPDFVVSSLANHQLQDGTHMYWQSPLGASSRISHSAAEALSSKTSFYSNILIEEKVV